MTEKDKALRRTEFGLKEKENACKMCWFHLAKVTLISTYSEVKEVMYMYTAFFDS